MSGRVYLNGATSPASSSPATTTRQKAAVVRKTGSSACFLFAYRIEGGNCMPRIAWKADQKTDSAAQDVLAAYDVAVRRGKPPVECYRAAVDAWVRAHPDQVRTYAARQALDVVIGARVHMRV